MKVELLAPAGSYEALEAALRAGADAVYLGGEKFGARAYADNLDRDQMIQAIDDTHLHGKKLYLTVNTVLKNREIERELYDYVAPYYEAGLDAVIVQDLGVLSFIRRNFPGLHIHASTQMTITGVESAKLLKEAGVSRIVTARELSLEEIRAIYDATHMEIESFVHGALCYCYSGQCLMSSLIGGRSGNRGRCAQPCRLPYQVYREGKLLNNARTSYPLSPKDMCTVGILPEIIQAGVHSLKIEGRMKKPEYTAGVVEIYRKYLDRYLAGKADFSVSREDYQILMDIYNRDGFHESYYKVRNGRDMMALRNEKKSVSGEDRKAVRNEELFSRIRKTYLEEKKQEKIKGTLSLFADCPAILEVVFDGHRITVEGALVQEAQNRPLEEERVRRQMQKTGDTEFAFETLDIYMGEDIFLPMQQLNELRRNALTKLRENVLEPYRRKAENRPEVSENPAEKGPVAEEGLSASVIKKEQLEAVMKIPEIIRIYADCGIFPAEGFEEQAERALAEAKQRGKALYLMLPHIVRDRELKGRKESFEGLIGKGLKGFLVRNLESFGILKSMGLEQFAVPDANLYTMNEESRKFWENQGVSMDTVPLELNQKELRFRQNTASEMIVYGYIPMMISVQCVQKNLDKCNHKCAVLTLKDRYQKEFPVVCSCEFCYNTIYNSLPVSLLKEADGVKKLGISRYRLSFTLETGAETERIARVFADVYQKGENPGSKDLQMEVTKGHFNRGVE
ncbi:MAG: U32 family peptidase [Clostridiales bacterium]|nr:U32 family peptidase [Clostridiales bacterium]